MTNDFRKYAVKHLGMNGLALDQYAQFTSSYLSPSIMEERQLNVTQMDVFSRLMMDRIIFLGTPIDDYTYFYDLYRYGRLDGRCIVGCRDKGKTFCFETFPGYDTSTDGRRTRSGFGYRDYGKGDTET